MKKLYILLALLVLASCEGNEFSTTDTIKNTVVQETSREIEGAINELSKTEDRPEKPAYSQSGGLEGQAKKPYGGPKPKPEAPVASYVGGEITDSEIQEGKVVELSTTYISPKTEVIMNISYTLDEDNKFSKIAITSPNYSHMSKFNNGIQNVIGLTIEEATGYNVAGSTLGSVAFSKVLKEL